MDLIETLRALVEEHGEDKVRLAFAMNYDPAEYESLLELHAQVTAE